ADQHDLAEHELVVATADRIRALEHRLKDAVGPIAGRLLRARPVEGPDRRLFAARHDLRLRTQLLRWLGPVDPDVFGAVDAHAASLLRARKNELRRLYRDSASSALVAVSGIDRTAGPLVAPRTAVGTGVGGAV